MLVESVAMNPSKVNAILKCKLLKSVTEVRSFMGLACCYLYFIKGFSRIAASLTKLIKKEQPFVWDEKCEALF